MSVFSVIALSGLCLSVLVYCKICDSTYDSVHPLIHRLARVSPSSIGEFARVNKVRSLKKHHRPCPPPSSVRDDGHRDDIDGDDVTE